MEKYYDNKGFFINYYEMIGVNKDASTEEIIRNGNSAIMFAGDISRNNANMEKVSEKEKYQYFSAIMEAIKVLSNSETRAEYDAVYDKEMAKSSQENESNLQSIEQLDKLLKENEDLRKLNDEREEYINELERKLSTKSNQETIDDYKEDDDDIKEDDDDIKKELLDILNQDGDRDIDIIDIKNSKKNNDVSKEVKEEPKVEEKTDPVIKIEKNNDNTKNNGNDNNIKPIFKDTEEEPQKVEKVEEVDKKERFAVKLSSLGSKAFITVAGISALAIAILTYSSNSSKRAESILEENGIDKNSIATNMINSIDDDTEVEEEITEQVSTIEEEPYEVELDVNSDTVIYETVDKIESEISKISDPVVKDMFNRETIEALVRYTRDNTILSGETAYELFQVLYNNGIDTSMFFENLDSYQVMNTLFLSTKAIDQNNNSYDDENNAYNAINSAVDYLSPDDYAAIWNLSAITDQVTGYSSMLIASGCAEENGLEGSEYQNELNSVPAEVRENAKKVYNKVKPYDNSYIMQLRINALDNENVRTLG
ncbi:MAG: hypothetical protein E7159_05370 [Firmicutes bacterium]|jgi:curved DNA-binding protein CbpA|nr:hypothetical protein [Bacillota bacterium]